MNYCSIGYFATIILATIVITRAWKTSDLQKPIPADATRWSADVNTERFQIKKTSLTGALDPKKTWRTFLRLSSKNERKEEKKKKKAVRQLRSGNIYARGPIGPQGPRGPRGHRGPKGANVTKEEIFEEFRTMVREMASRKFQLATDPMCTDYCIVSLDSNNTAVETPETKVPAIFDVNEEVVVSKVVTAFLWELATDMIISRKTFVELQKFLRPFSSGGYERNVHLSNHDSGRFIAPTTGFYTFFVRLHLQLPTTEVDTVDNKGDELFSVLLCIESLCQENMNLESISGFGFGQKITASVNGMLHLEEKQYVSIYIDNYSSFPLRIYDGSQFSGHLTGI